MSVNHPRKKTKYLTLAINVLVLASLACSLGSFGGSSGNSTTNPVAEGNLGDYGDAPDGDHNMDTGYYEPTGGPFFFTYESAGIASNFPTMGDDPIPGAFTVDVDEFWIGPLFGGSSDADIPSLEDDADDPNDPDNVANLLIDGGGADCDAENGSHNPAGNGCGPVPAYSLPMNARLMIFFGYPPLGVWITTVHASETMSYSGPIYWNLLYDLNQDGSWNGSDEWVAQDIAVNLAPGESKTLISPAFRLPTSGTPWGRLHFPNWVRSTVTSESVVDKFGSTGWDGRGPEDGFAVGEVEDYFVEWQPIGQKFPNKEPENFANCALSISELDFEKIPTNRDAWKGLELTPGVHIEGIRVLGTTGPDFSGRAVETEILPLDLESVIPFSVKDTELIIKISPQLVRTEGEAGTGPVRLFYLPEVPPDNPCTGSAPVGVGPAYFTEFFPQTGVTVSWHGGFFGIDILVIRDKAGHITFVGMPEDLVIEVLLGSITIKGPHPWVEVTGDFNEDTGEFSAAGKGTVAGFPNIAVTFTGQLRAEGISGEYTMGADGGLPQKEPIVYAIDGKRVEDAPDPVEADGPVPLDSGVDDAIESFVDVFNAAFVDGNPDHLYQLLEPGVVDLYGEESCRLYLGGIVETPTVLEYLHADWVGSWIFERDESAVAVEDAYIVLANFTSNDQTNMQELHLTLPGDDSVHWFTDCGDPLVSE